jgi:TetR/AcrR family transcriptional regulator, transcriptional repressor of bet genes
MSGGTAPARRSFHHAGEEARRRDLVAATLDIVAELGLEKATVREIAKRAGVTPGLIRHYFENKELMFQAAYHEIADAMLQPALDAAQGEAEAHKSLKAYILACFRPPVTNLRNLTLWATFISQLSVEPALAAINRERYLIGRGRIEDYVTRTLRDAGRTVRKNEVRALSIAVNGVIDGLWLEAAMAPDLFAQGELARIALSAVERILGLSLAEGGGRKLPKATSHRRQPGLNE